MSFINIIYMDLFCKSQDDIKENFIQFALLTPLIDGCNIINNLSITFEIFYDEWKNEYLSICQTLENSEIIRFATFYNYYNYTQGLKELIKNVDLHEYFKILINFENTEGKVKLFINVYIDKLYLLDIYEKNIQVPNLLYKIIIDKSSSYFNTPKFFHNIKNTTIFSTNLNTKNYKRKLYNYQKKNINWMKDTEKKILNNCLSFQYYNFDITSIAKYHIDSINEDIYLDTINKNILDIKQSKLNTLCVRGGVLCDESGLGKTSSMIGLIKNDSSKKNTTLIVCPRRICKQWMEEINKTVNLKTLILHSIKQTKIMNDKKIREYDIIIVPYSIFHNKKYIEESSNNKCFCIENFFWHRVILDEFHEYICKSKKNNTLLVRDRLNIIVSTYRWLCSATPDPRNVDYLIEYLTSSFYDKKFLKMNLEERNQLLISHRGKVRNTIYVWEELISTLCKRNTKDSVNKEINVPNPNIETIFLDQNVIEKAIYDSCLDDKVKLIELCNHVQVSDQHIRILGNKPISLTETHEKMTNYYYKKIKMKTNNIKKLELLSLKSKNEIENKIKENKKELLSLQYKYSIFNNLTKNIDNQKCPICLESISDLTKVITMCGHFFCSRCLSDSILNYRQHKCPICREVIKEEELRVILPNNINQNYNKWGTKMANMISYVESILSSNRDNKIIIFSQFDNMLKLLGNVLTESNINYLTLNGSFNVINSRIKKFKLDSSIRIVLLSSDKAASGLNLTEANHILLLDTHNAGLTISDLIEEQAIGRAVRIGQNKNVEVKRFVMRNTIEEENYNKNIKKNIYN